MSRVLEWLKQWGAALLGLVLIGGAGWLWKREHRKRLDAEALAEVARLQEQVAIAKSVRTNLLGKAIRHDAEITRLGETIDSNERAILRAHEEPLEGLTRDQIRERLRHLGF